LDIYPELAFLDLFAENIPDIVETNPYCSNTLRRSYYQLMASTLNSNVLDNRPIYLSSHRLCVNVKYAV
jgi:hypothetical protein